MTRLLGAVCCALITFSATVSAAPDIDFTIADGFQLETVLKEPGVRQPLSVNFDERGRLWVTQYLQFPFPKGLKVIGHDKYWRIQYDRFPPLAPPNHEEGQDRVTIYEDTNGDGTFDNQKDFVTGLNITTSALPGRGGVWVLNPPYLLFYPDANQDDVPDGDPEVHLAGFGLEDLHAVSNGLRWGADGWLYGYQGSTTTATITRPGMGDEGLHFKGQNLWRYNTADKRFELFMEGGQNNFGIALDAEGRMFTGSNGGLLGFHAVQGGYYSKSWAKHGELTNPYAYGFFEGMKDFSSHPKLSQGMVSYDAAQFPEEYQHYLFTLRALKRCVSGAELKPKGSTYTSHEKFQLLETDDPHFRPVGMTQGPDGALYIADWHDTNITWNVSAENDRTLRETGRVYRVTHGGHEAIAPFDMGALETSALLDYLKHANKWYRQTALRILYDRKDGSVIPALKTMVQDNDGQTALEALWALNACGGFDFAFAEKTLGHPNPHVRRWTIQLLGNDHKITSSIHTKLLAMVAADEDPQVRSQLASTSKRLPAEQGLALITAFFNANKDMDDLHIPMLLWWAVEGQIRQDREATLAWCVNEAQANHTLFRRMIIPRLGQRFTQDKTDADFIACGTLLAAFSEAKQREAFLGGVAQGLGQGTEHTVPAGLNDVLAKLLQEDSTNTQLMIIAARLGNKDVFDAATKKIADTGVDKKQRLDLIKLLGEERYSPAKDTLLALFQSKEGDDIRGAALSAVQRFPDDAIALVLLDALANGDSLKSRIASAMASRKAWAKVMLEAVDSGKVPVDYVARDLLINLAALKDAHVDALVQQHWGTIRTSPDDKQAQVNAVWATVKNGPGNAKNGIIIYEEVCGKCHVHLGVGRKVGPDITGLNRKDSWDFTTNIIDPSRSVLPEYTGMTFTLLGEEDGLGGLEEQIITGFLLREVNDEITLVDSAGNEMTVPVSKVKSMEPMALSVMPEGLVTSMGDQDLRDLFAFIQANTLPGK